MGVPRDETCCARLDGGGHLQPPQVRTEEEGGFGV